MKLHRNAALSWQGRRLLALRVLEKGWTIKAAAEAAGVSGRCARKWVGRYTRRPQTNGKVERFIRTLLSSWAYGAIYRSSHERTAALDG